MAFSVRYGWVVISMAVLCFRFNYSKVVIIIAVLHHKVVASLREKKEIESGIIVNKGGNYKQR